MSLQTQNDYPVYVAAGAELPLPVGGDFIFVKSSTGPLRIIVLDGNVEMDAGDARQFSTFENVLIRNETISPISAVLVIGRGDFRRLTLTGSVDVNPGSAFADVDDVVIGPSSSVMILPADSDRKSFVVTSLEANSSIVRIGTANVTSSRGYPLSPSAGYGEEHNGEVWGLNTGTADHTVAVSVVLK